MSEPGARSIAVGASDADTPPRGGAPRPDARWPAVSRTAGERIEVDGVGIFVERHGAGPALVLVPGLGAGTWLWRESMDALGRRYSLIMPELRGTGRSDKPDERYSVERFAADVLGVLDRLGVERFHLLGASLGGFVAQVIATEASDRVRRLVLVATSPGGAEQVEPSGEVLARTIRPRGRSRRERMEEVYELGFSPGFRERSRPLLAELDRRRAAHPQPEAIYYRQLLAGAAYDGAERARRIRRPTLICAGTHDPIVPPANADVLAELIPDARVARFEGRHLFFMERSEAFNRTVTEFLEKCGDAAFAPPGIRSR